MNLRREWTRAVFEELYYTANNQKIADKKKTDYQEGLEKSRADSAARSRESYKNDLEKSHDDSAARSRDIGVGTGGLEGQFPPNILLCIKELTVIKDWYLTDY